MTKLNKLIDHFSLLNQHEHLSNMETEGKTHHKVSTKPKANKHTSVRRNNVKQ